MKPQLQLIHQSLLGACVTRKQDIGVLNKIDGKDASKMSRLARTNNGRWFHYSVLLFVVTTLLVVTNGVQAIHFTPTEKSALKAGKTVKRPLPTSGKNGFYGGSGYTVIDAPVEVVWRVLEDWRVYASIFAATANVREVSRRGNQSVIHYKMGHKFISLDYYLNVKRDKKKNIMSFALMENRPHDINNAKGYWRLFPQKDGRTLVTYVVTAQVPLGVVNLLNDKWKNMIQRNLIGAPNDVKKLLNSSAGEKYFAKANSL